MFFFCLVYENFSHRNRFLSVTRPRSTITAGGAKYASRDNNPDGVAVSSKRHFFSEIIQFSCLPLDFLRHCLIFLKNYIQTTLSVNRSKLKIRQLPAIAHPPSPFQCWFATGIMSRTLPDNIKEGEKWVFRGVRIREY